MSISLTVEWLLPRLARDAGDHLCARLCAHQIIERIPHSCSCQVTADGLTIALFFTRLT